MLKDLGIYAIFMAMGVVLSLSANATETVSIAAGDADSGSPRSGEEVCYALNQGETGNAVSCWFLEVADHVAAVVALGKGRADFIELREDRLGHAQKGISRFEAAGDVEGLRLVFPTPPVPFTVVARSDAGIRFFQELKGKRINIGKAGSGLRGVMDDVLHAMGWGIDDFSQVLELDMAEQSKALCDDKIDAMVYVVRHPSNLITQTMPSCELVFVRVDGPAIDKLVADRDLYEAAVISGGVYEGFEGDIKSFGIGSNLVTKVSAPDDVVYNLVKSVFSDLEAFKQFHPAFASLQAEMIVTAGSSLPFHPAAARFYREKGWLK